MKGADMPEVRCQPLFYVLRLQFDILYGPELQGLGVGADLFKRVQDLLKSRTLVFLDDPVL